MKAGVYHGPDDVRIEEVDTPALPADGILVSVKTCGLCGTDVAKYRHRLVEPPVVLGHEVAGEVAAVGPEVHRWAPGDRVVVPHHIPCFVCEYCRHGNFSACPEFRTNQISPGGFAECIAVAGPSVRKGALTIPDSLSDDQAALCESLACCLRAFKRSKLKPGDSFAVVGCGPVGLMHLMLASAMGAGPLVGLDVSDLRLQAVESLCAAAAVDASKAGFERRVKDAVDQEGADVVMVCVGSPTAVDTALKVVRRGGEVHLFAESPPDSLLRLDPNVVYHETSLVGTYSSSPADQAEALALIAHGRVPVERLVTHRLPLDKLQTAFDLAVGGGEPLKILIKPGLRRGA